MYENKDMTDSIRNKTSVVKQEIRPSVSKKRTFSVLNFWKRIKLRVQKYVFVLFELI